jgi:hypothetical protein
MDSGLDDFQSLPFPSDEHGLDPPGHYRLLLVQADVTLFIIYSYLSLDSYCSYRCTFNLMTTNVASCV